MKSFYVPLEIKNLDKVLEPLPHLGRVVSSNNYTFLDIDDRFIHDTFPLLAELEAQKPDYFDVDRYSMGAHITIFYPEEEVIINENEIGTIHHFTVKELAMTELLGKKYYLLKVDSPSLIALRKRYGLGKKLFYKNHFIDLHITIAVGFDIPI